MGDPVIIPLWYGEGDLPTPDLIGAHGPTGAALVCTKNGQLMRRRPGDRAEPGHRLDERGPALLRWHLMPPPRSGA